MSLGSRCGALLLLLVLGSPGCSPTGEPQMDEEKNPHFQAGREKLSALDYKGAVESFERAVEDNPRSARAHYELGVLFDQQVNDYAAALYHYQKALKLRPNAYPAENIRQRIPACRQELIKADSLAVINPSVLRETERLREENSALQKKVEALQAALAGRTAAGTAPAAEGASAQPGREAVSRGQAVPTAGSVSSAPAGSGAAAGSAGTGSLADRARQPATPAAGRGRTHVVKAGETPAAIARQHQIKVTSLLAANPGLDPKRLRVGQVLSLP